MKPAFILLCSFCFLICYGSHASAQTWTKISCGGEFTLGLQADGSLWAWGFNGNGQLGLGHTNTTPFPTRVGNANDWADIAGGGFHSIALKKNGTIWGAGDDIYCQTGLGTVKQINTKFGQIGSDSDWVSIAAGYASSFALKKDGSLYGWGYNVYGGLGDSTTLIGIKPKLVHGNVKFKQVAVGGIQAIAIATNGSLWAWGYNGDGSLGNGNRKNSMVPIQITKDTDWVSISTGFEFSLALKKDGSLWSWGFNNSGQLGTGDTLTSLIPVKIGADNDWRYVAAGSAFSFAIKKNNTLYAWGWNELGQLGINSKDDQLTPVKVENSTDWISISGATGITDGQNLYGTHAIGLKTGSTGYCAAGANYNSQLGTNSTADFLTFDCSLGAHTGIENPNFAGDKIKIYPNPTTGNFTLNVSKPGTIYVRSITGQLIFSGIAGNALPFEYNLANYPKGIYFVQEISGNETSVEKLILE